MENFKTVTKYIMECSCGAKKTLDKKPGNYEKYICKKCIEELKEPKLEDYDNFYDFILSIDNWEYSTGKTASYNMSNIKEDAFKSYGVSGDKAEKAWVIAYENEHSGGYTAIIASFDELVELIK